MTFAARASHVLALARSRNTALICAESCTGGLLAAALTEPSGASDVFFGGFVTYMNLAKRSCLEIPAQILESKGAVSEETALAMAFSAHRRTVGEIPHDSLLSVSITGVAGPEVAGPEADDSLPAVGTVIIGYVHGRTQPLRSGVDRLDFSALSGRAEVRAQSVFSALERMEELLQLESV